MKTRHHIEVTMVVISKSSGVAKFTDPDDVPEDLRGDGSFRSAKFQGREEGTIIVCTFRYGDSSRRLLRVRNAKADEADHEEVEQPVADKRDEKDAWLNGVFFDEKSKRIFDAADQIAKALGAVNVMISGPSGYGKTSMPEAFASFTGRKYLRMDCGTVRDPEEWFGYREAKDGSTVFEPTEFTKVVMEGDAVIVLDELNRIEPWVHASLFPLLDHAREAVIHGETIKVGPNVIFAATANVGYQYAGTFALDAALLNRMDVFLEVGPMSSTDEVQLLVRRTGIDEKDAKRIVDVMFHLHKDDTIKDMAVDISTRSSLKVATLVHVGGMRVYDAFMSAIVYMVSDPSARKPIIDIVSMAV